MTSAGPPAPPALPAHLRRPAAVAVGLATLVFALLGTRYAGESGHGRLVATGAHYPTDTVGGFCAAVAFVLGTALLLETVAAWWHGMRTGHRTSA